MPTCSVSEAKREVHQWVEQPPQGWIATVSGYRLVTDAPSGWSVQSVPASVSHAIDTGPRSALTDHQKRMRELRAKSDAAVASGMPVLSIEEINAEVAELRGNGRGDL